MVRRVPLWGRFVVVPLAIVVTLVAGYSIGYAVAATHVPRTTVGSVTPADHGLPYRDVQFRTGDGVTLSGWYVASDGEVGVVLLHGAGNTRSDVLDHAVVLARHGFHVLLFDARGHGRSGGTAMDFGWYGDADVSAAVTFLQGQPGIDGRRIAVVGMSMGGEEAIGAAAADPRIRAVVAEGATGRVAGDLSWLSDEYGWRGAVQERLSGLMFGATKVLTEAEVPITLQDAVAQADVPVLMIAAGDVADEARAGRFVQSGSPTTVDLWVVPDAGHTAGLDTDPVEWTQHVSSFLDAALAVGDE
jgi:pimeloyl-ACP methyl ester carboxylesterase